MKKIFLLLLPLIGLSGCFEDVNTSLGRDQFIGNYDFALSCTGSQPNSNHIIFIEKPLNDADSLSAIVIIRNLFNQNQTIQAVVSQRDIILNDDTVLGTGTLSDDTNELTLSLNFTDNQCSGIGTRRL